MKTKLFILFLLSTWVPSIAQDQLEISIGPGFTNVSLSGLNQSIKPGLSMQPGIQAQVLYHKTLTTGFSIGTGLAYKEKGFIMNENIETNVLNIPLNLGVSAVTSMNYIEVPIQFRYTLGQASGTKAYAFAGPSVGYALNGDIRTRANLLIDININKTNLNLNDNIYNRLEMGVNVGVGGEIPFANGSLMAGINYMKGLSRVIDNTLIDFKARNYGIGLNIGYKINF